jgi:hypothetical protein
VLLLKEFDDDWGEHFGVNHVDLTFERVAAGVWHGILLFFPVSMFRLKNCRTFTLFTSW